MVNRILRNLHDMSCKPLSEIVPEVLDKNFMVVDVATRRDATNCHQARQKPAEVVVTVGDVTFTLIEVIQCQTP